METQVDEYDLNPSLLRSITPRTALINNLKKHLIAILNRKNA